MNRQSDECEYGDHGPLRTWCYHKTYTRGRGPVAQLTGYCHGDCPLFEIRTSDRPKRVTPISTTCIHLGEVTGDVPCKTCGGKVVATHKHACGLGGECIQRMRHVEWAKEQAATVGERLRIKCCETCQDRTKTPIAPATPLA